MHELREYVQVRGLQRPETMTLLRNYLFKSAVNPVKNRLKQRAIRRQSDELAIFKSQDGESEERRSEQICATSRDVEFIRRALNELPANCHEAFRLVRLQGLSCKEAAQRLGLRPRQVRRLVARALASCLAALESESRVGSEARAESEARGGRP